MGTYPNPPIVTGTPNDGDVVAFSAALGEWVPVPQGVNQAAVTASVNAAVNALVNGAPGALDTLKELADAINDDASFAATVTAALAAKQPLDPDLTAIAALLTTSFGRSLLTLADAAAVRTAIDAQQSGTYLPLQPTAYNVKSNGSQVAATRASDGSSLYLGTDTGAALTAIFADMPANGAHITFRHDGNDYTWTTAPAIPRNIGRVLEIDFGGSYHVLGGSLTQFLTLKKVADHDVFKNVQLGNGIFDCNNVADGSRHVLVGSLPHAGNQVRLNFQDWLLDNIDILNVPYDPTGVAQRRGVGFEVFQAATGEGTQNWIKRMRLRAVRCNPANVTDSGPNRGINIMATLSDNSTNSANVFIDDITVEDCRVFTGHDQTGSTHTTDTAVQVGSLGNVGDVTVRRLIGGGQNDVFIEIDNARNALVDDCEATDVANVAYLSHAFTTNTTGETRRTTFRNCRNRIISFVPSSTHIGAGFGSSTETIDGNAKVDIDRCSVFSTSPSLYNGMAWFFAGLCPDVDIRDFHAEFPNLVLAPGSNQVAAIGYYSTTKADSRFSVDGYYPKLVGSQSTLFTQTIETLMIEAGSADATFNLRRVSPSINITNLIAGSIIGIALGTSGVASQTLRGGIDRFRWRVLTGDSAPVGINIRRSNELTIDNEIAITRPDFTKQTGGTQISIGDDTNRSKVFAGSDNAAITQKPMQSGRYYWLPNYTSSATTVTNGNGTMRSVPAWIPNAVTLSRIGAEVTLAGEAARTVTDGVLNSTTTITSATASFVANDVGRKVTGTGIPTGTYIASVTNGTTAVLTAAATATASGVSLTFSGSLVRLGIYNDDGTGRPGALLIDAGTIDGTSATVQELTISQAISPGLYHFVWVVQASPTTQPTLRALSGHGFLPGGIDAGTSTPTAGQAPTGYQKTGTTAVLPTSFGTPAVSGSGSTPRIFGKVA